MRGIHVGEYHPRTNTYITETAEVNFSPAFIVAKASLANVSHYSGSGGGWAAIKSYRERPQRLTGPDRTVDANYVSHIWGPNITSVTFVCGAYNTSNGWTEVRAVSEVQFW